MGLYCTGEFRDEVEKLRKTGSHAGIEADIIEAYCNTTFAEWRTGDLLFAVPTGAPDALFLKRRLDGRGGFRVYGIAKVRAQSFYLGFIHPKTGRFGGENLTDEKRKWVPKHILSCIKSGELLELVVDKPPGAKFRLAFRVPKAKIV